MGSLVLDLWFAMFLFGLSFRIFRWVSSVRDLWFKIFRLGSFVWDLWFGTFRLGSIVWDL